MAETRGFTLIELMVALGVLMLGFTSLIGVMGVGVDTRRTAELRSQATRAVDQVVHHVRTTVLAGPDAGAAGELPAAVVLDPIDGYPRLRAEVAFTADPAHADLVLLTIRILWYEEGVAVGEEFRRIVENTLPFPTRVARARRSS